MNEQNPAEGPILVVEDYDDSRFMIRRLLEGRGFSVIEATNGIEAINIAEQKQPRLILMDLRMPVLDGISAIEEIRKLAHLKRVPILILSGDGKLSKEAFELDELESEWTRYLSKPFGKEELLAQIATFLEPEGED